MYANPKVHLLWNTTDSRKIISLFFQLPLFTGNFHVVNGRIDWRSALFVLRSVHHLSRKQEREPRRFDLMGGSDQWLQHGLLFSQGCLWLHLNAFMFSAKVSVWICLLLLCWMLYTGDWSLLLNAEEVKSEHRLITHKSRYITVSFFFWFAPHLHSAYFLFLWSS